MDNYWCGQSHYDPPYHCPSGAHSHTTFVRYSEDYLYRNQDGTVRLRYGLLTANFIPVLPWTISLCGVKESRNGPERRPRPGNKPWSVLQNYWISRQEPVRSWDLENYTLTHARIGLLHEWSVFAVGKHAWRKARKISSLATFFLTFPDSRFLVLLLHFPASKFCFQKFLFTAFTANYTVDNEVKSFLLFSPGKQHFTSI